MELKNLKLRNSGFVCMAFVVSILLWQWCGNCIGAETFPTKEIEVIINYPPGGSTDTFARIVGNTASKHLGVPLIYINKAGAGGAVAADFVKNAKPDGYTVGTGGVSNLGTVIATNPRIPYTLKDFSIICRCVITPIIVVTKKGRFDSFESFVKEAKAKPNVLMYGSYGTKSSSHFAGELIKEALGIKVKHIAFEGGAKALAAALGGHVDVAILTVATSLSNIKAGTLSGLTLTTPYRVDSLPDVPNIKEVGYPNAAFYSHEGFMTGSKIAEEKLAILRKGFEKSMAENDVQEAIKKAGMLPSYLSGPEYEKSLETMLDVYKKVAIEAGMLEK